MTTPAFFWDAYDAAVSSEADCIDDVTLVALAEGRVPQAEREVLLSHADVCELCAQLLSQAVRMTSSDRTQLGRYEILEELGTGAMGRVLLAFDPQLRRDVALKVVREEAANRDRSGRRLRKEARALARLRHPNVVEVYDVQESEGELFIAMEYVRGESLARWLAAAPRHPAEIIALLADASRGLEAAHREGVVHRDFKPANVMVTAEGRVVVVDFGLAVCEPGLDATIPGAANAAATHGAGTPVYMAPEQWEGEATPQSDQFALCLTLVGALTGRLPYPIGTPHAMREAKVRGAVDREVLARLPPRIEAAVRRGLAPHPADRWPSMAALRGALAPRRRRWVGLTGAAAGVLLLGGVAARGKQPDPCAQVNAQLHGAWDPDVRQAVERGLDRAGATDAAVDAVERGLDLYAAQWGSAFTESCRAAADSSAAPERDPDATLRCLRRARADLVVLTEVMRDADDDVVLQAAQRVATLPRIDSCGRARTRGPAPYEWEGSGDLELDPEVRALSAEITRARLLLSDNAVEQAAADADRLLAEARRLGHKPVVLQALLLRAELGKYAGGAGLDDMFAEAFALARELGNRRDAALAALIGASAAARRGRNEEARRWLDLARVDLARDADPLLLARYASTDSSIYLFRGELEQGIALSQAAVEYSAAADAGGLKHAIELANLSGAYRLQGQLDVAAYYLRAAQEMIVARGGERHSLLQHIHVELGAIAVQSGEPDAAVADFKTAIELYDLHLGPRSKEAITARQGLAMAHFDAGRPAEAKVSIEEALKLAEGFEFQAVDEGFLWFVLAEAERALGDTDAAEQAYVHGLAALDEAPASPRRDEMEAFLTAGRNALSKSAE